MKTLRLTFLVVCAVLAVSLLLTGCEDTPTANSIAVTASANPIVRREAVTLVATPAHTNQVLYLPLNWVCRTPSLGYIKAAEGQTAIYESYPIIGNAIIAVTDQGESEGVIVIRQE